MALLIRAAGLPRDVAPAHGVAFSLAELRGFVGGYIEVVRTRLVVPTFTTPDGGGPIFLVLNEEGKLLQLPLNPVATHYLRTCPGYETDFAVGDVLLATALELGEGCDDGDKDDDGP